MSLPIADPFLLAHQAGPRFFDLSGKLIPISIRDQMIRGRLLVDRAVGEKLIGSDSPLLVIGAGACGATAAIRAAELDVPTLLIDRDFDPFRRQENCRTRWIDPTQYDWPSEGWNTGSFNWSGASMPLRWSADRSRDIAVGWTYDLAAAVASMPGLLTVAMRTRLDWPPAFFNDKVHLLLRSPAGSHRVVVGMVIVAVGGGDEETRAFRRGSPPPAGAYRGFRFWEDEPFEDNQSGIGQDDHVLISGAGDGRSQDFLRLTTRQPSARAIYDRCGIPDSVRLAIFSAEERARSALHWNLGRRYEHEVNEEVERVHAAQVREALKAQDVLDGLTGLLADRPASTKLVHSCTHLACLYGLNRFLTLLILKFMEGQRDRPVERIMRSGVVEAVDNGTTPHACGLPGDCHGKDHLVTLLNYPRCYENPQGEREDQPTANVIVIRHGINPDRIPWLSLTPLANHRQILPDHLAL